MSLSQSPLQRMFRESDAAVRARFEDAAEARKHYAPYRGFVLEVAGLPRERSLLDVGCGVGWSSHGFAEAGFRTTGVDLNARAFQATEHTRLSLLEGSALALPFADESFDVVATHEMLEHIPEPELALSEMLRVAKPGGLVCVVGPNLLSPLTSLRALTGWVWEQKPLWRVMWRQKGMARHPFGDTVPEATAVLAVNALRLGWKLLARKPIFTMREPDLIPPFYADNDACYLCNPVDLVRYFRARGHEILCRSKPGRPDWSWIVAGGTWVAAQKQQRAVHR